MSERDLQLPEACGLRLDGNHVHLVQKVRLEFLIRYRGRSHHSVHYGSLDNFQRIALTRSPHINENPMREIAWKTWRTHNLVTKDLRLSEGRSPLNGRPLKIV